ncbi:thiopeptide-type bacteriocin biosynthesis protein [Streptomyces sp. NBC_00006]|uniref:thiopeptide-type bacteriocin biosynthesis protein n=1 Tax=Streptomyces sp. NBC_00006 TaxID=2975619 RepID=UPI00224F3012|nr:thiopeptide-type bacteriocin biosynthesis protein [Streptomyces sp. NBC_00006]MCX5535181.1 thiopeptide-type bacteriocin biosynthesis protein [Streptomyces sp. NBC_00006]
MPPHRLIPTTYPRITGEVANAVLDVLAGQPTDDVARRIDMDPVSLSDAVDAFVAAGTDATFRHQYRPSWLQVYVEFPGWHDADHIAAEHLLPLLLDMENSGFLSNWWFIRKHPYWRLRMYSSDEKQAREQLCARLDKLVGAGNLRGWRPGAYEPETAAFGGPTGMTIAHRLFAADSRHVLTQPAGSKLPLGRREVSLLLCTVMMRAAGLEWGEQGDVWDRVISEQHRNAAELTHKVNTLAITVRPLLLGDLSSNGVLFGRGMPLNRVAGWAAAFEAAGHTLRTAQGRGALERSVRRTLAYHVIFHWNRQGLSHGVQSALALAARTAVLDPPHPV